MNLKNISDDELKKLHEETKSKISKYQNLQLGMKVLLNGGYGALANRHFLYLLIDNAEAITTTGQVVNRWTSFRVNDLLNEIVNNENPKNYIVYGDTDSTFINAHDVVKAMGVEGESDVEITQKLDEFIKDIVDPEIQKYTDQLATYFNNVENKMVWEREVIASSCILVNKKRYAMKVLDSEGVHYYNNPKIKVTGLEAKRSSTPEWARVPLMKCYELALNNDKNGVHRVVKETRTSLKSLDVSDIAVPSGVNGVEKYTGVDDTYIKGTPKHVRASINHNRLIRTLGLTHIDKIGSGSNIKYLSLKKPNPLGDDVIGFISYMPKEFGLEKYVDYNDIFTRGFEKPLQNFLDALGWGTEEIITLF